VLGTLTDLGTVNVVASDPLRSVAAVASSDRGLFVVDLAGIASGAQPVKTRLPFTGFGSGVALRDGTAYAIEVFSGSPATAKLHVVDVRAPRAPVILASVSLPGAAVSGAVAVYGSAVYVGATDKGLLVFDVRNPRGPALVRSLPVYGSIRQIVLNAALKAAFVRSTVQYQAFDVRDPLAPGSLFSVANSTLRSFATMGNRSYYTGPRSLSIIEYASLVPKVSSGASHALSWDGSVVAGGSGVFLSQASEVWQLDLSDKTKLRVMRKLPASGYVRAMAVEGGMLFVADTSSRLTIFKVN
jgi:hypothetical protein